MMTATTTAGDTVTTVRDGEIADGTLLGIAADGTATVEFAWGTETFGGPDADPAFYLVN